MTTPTETDLIQELRALRTEIETLKQHRFFRIQDRFWSLLGYQFLRGVAMGLGTVIGATIVVSLLGYMLSQIELIPIIGDWAIQIADQIQADRP